MDWLAACIGKMAGAVFVIILRRLAYYLHSPTASGKQGRIPEVMSQTPLINKKQGKLDLVHAAIINKANVKSF